MAARDQEEDPNARLTEDEWVEIKRQFLPKSLPFTSIRAASFGPLSTVLQ
jgi:hypothetical protein